LTKADNFLEFAHGALALQELTEDRQSLARIFRKAAAAHAFVYIRAC
jgi:hypothetical protein